MSEPHILVVEDEPDIRESVAEYLRRNGLRASEAGDGAAMREILARDPADLVLLDIRLPGEDGLSLARELRAAGGIGIMMVTANRDMVDRVVGLELGADDYVSKPFELRELLARIRAVLRRIERAPAGDAAAEPRVRFGRCVLDRAAHRLIGPDGGEIAITASEFELLSIFAESPDEVLPRERLLGLASRSQLDPFDRSLDMRITRVRRKIERDPRFPRVIKTVRSAGYMFVSAAEG